MQDATLSSILLHLLEAKLRTKQAEREVSQLATTGGQRSRQVEVEYQQLHGLLLTARSLVQDLTTQ